MVTTLAPAGRRTTLGTGRTALICAAAVLSLGHHLHHVLRGQHLGWPLIEQVTPFTYSLAVYPLLLLGLALSWAGRVRAGFWLLLSGTGAVFLTAVHLGPAAIEPPRDIVSGYPSAALGWLAFAELLTLLAVLVAHSCCSAQAWRRDRGRSRVRPATPPRADDRR